jgi:hypothetical protein
MSPKPDRGYGDGGEVLGFVLDCALRMALKFAT